MIFKLDPKDFFKAAPLFQGLDYHLVIFSIIAQNSPGDIYVDNLEKPTTAFAWDKTEGGYYLAGDPENKSFAVALNEIIKGPITTEAKALGYCIEFCLNYYPCEWEKRIETIFKSIHVMKHERKCFETTPPLSGRADPLPEGYCFVPIDHKLMAREQLKNLEHIKEWIYDINWKTMENFLARGLGWCIVCDRTIVSWCLADYSARERLEIGIHTDENYRHRGFAARTVRRTLEDAFSRGYKRVGWHCWSSNEASAATALKAGFKKVTDHPIYHAWYNSFDNFLVQGHFLNQWGRYAESAHDYGKAFAKMMTRDLDFRESTIFKGDHTHWIFYNAAWSYGASGDSGNALRYLKEAVARGFEDPKLLKENEAFAELKENPEFIKILKNL